MDPELARLGLKDHQLIVAVRADAIEEIQIDKDNDSLEWRRWIPHFHVQVCTRMSGDRIMESPAPHSGTNWNQSYGCTRREYLIAQLKANSRYLIIPIQSQLASLICNVILHCTVMEQTAQQASQATTARSLAPHSSCSAVAQP